MVSPKTSDSSPYYDRAQLDPYLKKQNAKLVQVIQNFFTKSVQIILQSRLLHNQSTSDSLSYNDPNIKINKWFNMHMVSSSDSLKDDLKLWKGFSEVNSVPPMIVETYLDLRHTSHRDTVVLNDANGTWTVAKGGGKKHEVVLERWLIEFDPNDVSGSIIDELPLIYKQAIITFRSLYAFTRLMPAFALGKSLKQQQKQKKKSPLSLGFKILDGKQPISSKGRIGLSKSIIPHQMLTTESHISQKHFNPIQTSLGTLKISIAYRNHHNFDITDNEVILSDHFLNMQSDHHPQTNHASFQRDTGFPHPDDDYVHDDSRKYDDDRDDIYHNPHRQESSPLEDSIHQSQSQLPEQEPHTQDQSAISKAARLSLSSNRSMSVSPRSSSHPLDDYISTSGESVSRAGSTAISGSGHAGAVPSTIVTASSGTGIGTGAQSSAGTARKSNHHTSTRPSIQPFKIGSISSSPPPASQTTIGNFGGSSLERRISITSNRSTSNASLAALLRNPRGSTSSTSTTTNNIPIANSNATTTQHQATNTVTLPRSISSSHGSQLVHDDALNSPLSNPDSVSDTPRFSSSFGSRASRRFSNTSIRQSISNPMHEANNSFMGTSVGSTSSGAPISGLYIDDDISDFVRMIDSKSDLRFSHLNQGGNQGQSADSKLSPASSHQSSNSQLDALSKFQLLKHHHQQLGDNVSASLILSHNQVSGSRPSSRKSSHSVHSPPPSLPPNSYDKHLPSINSRLNDKLGADNTQGSNSHVSSFNASAGSEAEAANYGSSISGSSGSSAVTGSGGGFDVSVSRKNSLRSNASFMKNAPPTPNLQSAPVTSTTKAHATHKVSHRSSDSPGSRENKSQVSGLATTPSVYSNRKHIHYEDVFDDDDDDGEDFYLSHQSGAKKSDQSPGIKNTQSRSVNAEDHDDDDDDLLFTMSDMNLTK